MIDVQAIFDKYYKQKVEAEDPSNAFQCMDWAFKYCDELGIPREAIRHLYAFQAWVKPNDLTLRYFDYIPNTPNGVPILGDVLIFDTGVGPAGHISVTQKGDINSTTSMDQNWNGHLYCEYIQHPYDNILGWLRPKVLHPDTCPIDRDKNWNMNVQVFGKLGVLLDPNDKDKSVALALDKITELQIPSAPQEPPPTPPVPAPTPVTDYKPYLEKLKVGFYGDSADKNKWSAPWWASHLIDPRIKKVKGVLTESGV